MAKRSNKEKARAIDQPDMTIRDHYHSGLKLLDKVAIITGGDSGIGRAVAVHYALEGAHVVIVYHKSDDDATETQRMVTKTNQTCLLFKGDISNESFCRKVVRDTYKKLGRIDILVNNAGTHVPADELEEISSKQFKRTFEVNMFSFYYFTQEVLKKISNDGCVINTASVVAFRGSDHLIDYAATKGAVVSFTRSLSKNLAAEGIRVNAVAPGPIWTPLITASFDKAHIKKFGKNTPMGRAGYPYEVAPAYVFLASQDASYITGQVIHVNGGEVVAG